MMLSGPARTTSRAGRARFLSTGTLLVAALALVFALPGSAVAAVADRLDQHAQYTDARGRLFIRARIDAFLWERDYHKYPNVAVRPPPPPWAAAGYRTVIELNRPAPAPGPTKEAAAP